MAWVNCINCGEVRADTQTTTAGPLCLLCRSKAHLIEERIYVGAVAFTRILRDNRKKPQPLAAVKACE